MFLLDKNADWPQQWIDALHDPTSASKLAAFRTELEVASTGTFSTVESLVREVMASVYMEDLKVWKIALRQEFKKILDECKSTPVGVPESIRDDRLSLDYKLFLGASETPAIVQALTEAVNSANQTKLVGIDLLQEGGWWSTRLHLLAGLLAEYTGVEKIAFSANRKCLGTCGPVQVRRALAQSYPTVEKAFAESLPERRGPDSAWEISQIVERFSANLDKAGGEAKLRANDPPELTQITPTIARNFPGFNRELIPCRPDLDGIDVLPIVVSKEYPYVPLEFPDGDAVIIDRVRLASRIAQLAINRI
jgi:hypothetical protein